MDDDKEQIDYSHINVKLTTNCSMQQLLNYADFVNTNAGKHIHKMTDTDIEKMADAAIKEAFR